jgi:hypothetical protein
LAALAIGAGSLKAELSGEEFSYLRGWMSSVGFVYVETKEIVGVTCYVFKNDKYKHSSYIPVSVNDVGEAQAASVASRIAYAYVAEIGNEFARERYMEGYTEGQKQPEREVCAI